MIHIRLVGFLIWMSHLLFIGAHKILISLLQHLKVLLYQGISVLPCSNYILSLCTVCRYLGISVCGRKIWVLCTVRWLSSSQEGLFPVSGSVITGNKGRGVLENRDGFQLIKIVLVFFFLNKKPKVTCFFFLNCLHYMARSEFYIFPHRSQGQLTLQNCRKVKSSLSQSREQCVTVAGFPYLVFLPINKEWPELEQGGKEALSAPIIYKSLLLPSFRKYLFSC